MEHESEAKLRSGVLRRHPLLRLMYRLELAWVRASGRRAEDRMVRSCRKIIANYASVASLVREAYGHSLEIELMPYAAVTAFDPQENPQSPPELPGEPRDPLIVAVSRHDGRKGVDVLIRALSGL